MPRYQHIIWDWNGTLLNDVWLCLEAINHLLLEHHLPKQNEADYKRLFDFPVIDYYKRLGFDVSPASFEKTGAAFIDFYEKRRHECHLHHQAASVLAAIDDHHIAQSILSAYQQDALEDAVVHYRIRQHFLSLSGHHDIYASGKLERGKALVEMIPSPHHAILLVGDTLHDYDVAQAMGIDCLLIDHGHHTRERLQACDTAIVSSMDEAKTWILGLAKTVDPRP